MFSRLGSIIDALILIAFLILMAFAFIKYNTPKDVDVNEENQEQKTIVRLVQAGGQGLMFIADLFKKTEKMIEDNSETIEKAKSNAQQAVQEIDNLTKAGMEELGYQEFQYQELKEKSFWQDSWARIRSANFMKLWKTYWQSSKN